MKAMVIPGLTALFMLSSVTLGQPGRVRGGKRQLSERNNEISNVPSTHKNHSKESVHIRVEVVRMPRLKFHEKVGIYKDVWNKILRNQSAPQIEDQEAGESNYRKKYRKSKLGRFHRKLRPKTNKDILLELHQQNAKRYVQAKKANFRKKKAYPKFNTLLANFPVNESNYKDGEEDKVYKIIVESEKMVKESESLIHETEKADKKVSANESKFRESDLKDDNTYKIIKESVKVIKESEKFITDTEHAEEKVGRESISASHLPHFIEHSHPSIFTQAKVFSKQKFRAKEEIKPKSKNSKSNFKHKIKRKKHKKNNQESLAVLPSGYPSPLPQPHIFLTKTTSKQKVTNPPARILPVVLKTSTLNDTSPPYVQPWFSSNPHPAPPPPSWFSTNPSPALPPQARTHKPSKPQSSNKQIKSRKKRPLHKTPKPLWHPPKVPKRQATPIRPNPSQDNNPMSLTLTLTPEVSPTVQASDKQLLLGGGTGGPQIIQLRMDATPLLLPFLPGVFGKIKQFYQFSCSEGFFDNNISRDI